MTAAAPHLTPGADLPLPALRAELELLPGAADASGTPTWLIHDPLMNRFFQIEPAAREALKYWNVSRSDGELVARVEAEGRVHVDRAAVRALIDFLYASQLTEQPRADGWRSYVKAHSTERHALPSWLIHNYLFFRIPLLQPQDMLVRTLPWVRWLWSPAAGYVVALIGLAGLYLASRQWDLFLGSLSTAFTWEGLAASAIALALVKAAHELGHAYVAVHYGCRVHSMGIAFVLMAPLPYTDVTDSWRLTDRRKRLWIDGAGIVTEAGIAALALFAWAILPPGAMRDTTFMLSAVSIVSSLAINLNPFMRFDGYYLLSELLGVENLQTRAFAIGRWRMREILFGLGWPCPETMTARRVTWLALYAWAVWIYRLVLFTAIALLVYHYFFKVLGVILFAVEIFYFIGRPIAGELRVWWTMKPQILATVRTRWTIAGTALLAVAFVLPWSSTVEIPAILETENLQSIHPTRDARVVAVHVRHGDRVSAGDPLATLAASDIDVELARTRIELQLAQLQYGRRMADAADRAGSLIIDSKIAGLTAKIEGLLKERQELTILAPFAGRIVDLNPELHPGRWISPRDAIAVVAGGTRLIAKGYAAEADIGRIDAGAAATFIPEHPSRSRVALHIERIATAGSRQIEIPDLASTNTGRIAATFDDRRRLIPTGAQYLVTMSTTAQVDVSDLSIRGVALAEGRRESLLSRCWRRAIGVLVRESGA